MVRCCAANAIRVSILVCSWVSGSRVSQMRMVLSVLGP